MATTTMTTATPHKRPVWAAAGTFPAAWAAASHYARFEDVPGYRERGLTALTGLGLARLITIDRPQVEALPRPAVHVASYAETANAFLGARIPFDPCYLSLGGAPLERCDPVALLLGALVGRPAGKHNGWDGEQPIILPFVQFPAAGNDPPIPWMLAPVWATPDGWVAVDDLEALERWLGFAHSRERLQEGLSVSSDAAEIVASVLYFLQSANVELVEAPITRQERRATERKDGRIALTVAIRTPKRRPHHDDHGQHPDWTHRWEVRGHYKHFPAGTRLADSDPAKLVSHPTLGQCRRIWCPPHVKGPQDKPLIPKIRVMAGGEGK